MKEIKYIPVYNGEYNMTVPEYERQENKRAIRMRYNIQTVIEWLIISGCVFYLTSAIWR